MSTFKVGDRVRVYSNITYTGVVQTVDRIPGYLDVIPDNDLTVLHRVFKQQCRRLQPKKPLRRYWINVYTYHYYGRAAYSVLHGTQESALSSATGPQGAKVETIEVVEVKKV